MKKAPTIYSLRDLFNTSNGTTSVQIGSRWLPARPIGLFTIRNRLRATWLVFTGKADAVKWPGCQ